MRKLETYEFDELIFPFLIFCAFCLAYLQKAKKESEMEKEKSKIYVAMLSSSHHILKNFLNQMMIFKVTAQETPNFDPKVLSYFDSITEEALELLDNLSDITSIDEDSINQSVGTKTN